MKHTIIIAIAALAATSAFGQQQTTNSNGQGFSDNFSSYSGDFSTWNTNWATDRRLTSQVNAVNFQGNSAVDFTENSSNADNSTNGYFYNTQGIHRYITDGSGNRAYIGPDWQISGDLYITQDMLTSSLEYDSEIWGRDNAAVESQAWYPGIGFMHANINDWWPLHGNPNEPGGYKNDSSFFTGIVIDNVYDSTFTNPYVLIPTPTLTAGWHNFGIMSTGHSWVFSFDGQAVYTATGSNYSTAGLEGLTDVFLENTNFNDSGLSYMENPQTDVYWTNITAQAVPEPAELAPLLIGLVGLVARKRRK